VGYFPEAEKIWDVCPKRKEAAARAQMEAEVCIKWSIGQQYVGRFVGSEKMLERWIAPKVDEWVAGIGKLAEVVCRYPQSACVGLVHCLQAEWQYVCRVEP
jgi:hypothetical protein